MFRCKFELDHEPQTTIPHFAAISHTIKTRFGCKNRRHLSIVMFSGSDYAVSDIKEFDSFKQATLRLLRIHSGQKNRWKCIKIAVRAKLLPMTGAYSVENATISKSCWQFTRVITTKQCLEYKRRIIMSKKKQWLYGQKLKVTNGIQSSVSGLCGTSVVHTVPFQVWNSRSLSLDFRVEFFCRSIFRWI